MIEMVFTLIFMLGVGLPVGAVILRGAINLANRFLPVTPAAVTVITSARHTAARDESNPYSPPESQTSVVVAPTGGAIPEPGILRACVMVLVWTVISAIVSIFFSRMALAPRPISFIGWMGFHVIIQLFVSTLVIRIALPTSFPRAGLVSVLQLLISAAMIGLIGGAGMLA